MFKISCREVKSYLFWCLSFISNLHLRWFPHDYITFICKKKKTLLTMRSKQVVIFLELQLTPANSNPR